MPISANPFKQVSANPFGDTPNLKDTVSTTKVDPMLDGTEDAEKLKTVNFLQQKGFDVSLATAEVYREKLFTKDSSWKAINRQLTNELSVEPLGPVKKTAKASALRLVPASTVKYTFAGVAGLAGVAQNLIRNFGYGGSEYQAKKSFAYDLMGEWRKELKGRSAELETIWDGNVPEDVKTSLGGQVLTGLGQLFTLPMYAVPGVGPATTIGQVYDEALEESGGNHDIAGAYTIASAPLEIASDLLTMKAGKLLAGTTKGVKRTVVKKAVDAVVAGQIAGVGEGSTEAIQSATLQKMVKGEVDPKQVAIESFVGYIVGTVGGTGSSVAGAVDVDSRRKKLLDVGVTEETANALINGGINEENRTAIEAAAEQIALFEGTEPQAQEIKGFNNGPLTSDDIATLRQQPELIENLEPSPEAELLTKAVNEGDMSALAEYNQGLVGVAEEQSQPKASGSPAQEAPTPVEQAAVEPEITTDEEFSIRTGISIKETQAFRNAQKMADLPEPERRGHNALMLEAAQANRSVVPLIEELEQNPRPVEDSEVADLVLEVGRIRSRINSLYAERNAARESGDDVTADRLDAQIETARTTADRFDRVVARAKTRTAQGLAAMAIMSGERSYETADILNEATTVAGRSLTPEEADTFDKTATKIREKLAKTDTGKTLDEKIAEIEFEIETATRMIKEQAKTPAEKSEQQKRLAELRSIKRSQDSVIAAINALREGDESIVVEKAVNDPEGYKQTLKTLMDEIRKQRKALEADKSKSNQKRIERLNVLYNELYAQWKGKYRNIKGKQVLPPENVQAVKNHMAFVRKAMLVEDQISTVKEDLMLIKEGRLKELSVNNRKKRADTKYEELEADQNELFRLKRRLTMELDKISKNKNYLLKYAEFKRAVNLSMDSWLFRQGGKLFYSNPKMALEAWGSSLKAFGSEAQFLKLDRDVKYSADYNRMQNHGIQFNDLEGDFDVHQEAINSSLAEKIPGVMASNRSMAIGGNLLRQKYMRRIYAKFPTQSDEFYTAAAKFINELTGRGTLGGLEKSARGLTAFFTAPRWTTSNFQYLFAERHALIKNADGTTSVDKQLLKEISGQKARLALGFGSIAMMMLAMGFELELDPEEGDFLKFRKGDLVLDLLPGLSQSLRMIALAGESFFANTLGIGEMENPQTDFSKRLQSFFEYKQSPIVSEVFKFIEGKDVLGRETNPIEIITLGNMPIMAQTFYDDYIKEGAAEEDVIAAQTLQWFGIGAQIYEDRQTESRSPRTESSRRGTNERKEMN